MKLITASSLSNDTVNNLKTLFIDNKIVMSVRCDNERHDGDKYLDIYLVNREENSFLFDLPSNKIVVSENIGEFTLCLIQVAKLIGNNPAMVELFHDPRITKNIFDLRTFEDFGKFLISVGIENCFVGFMMVFGNVTGIFKKIAFKPQH